MSGLRLWREGESEGVDFAKTSAAIQGLVLLVLAGGMVLAARMVMQGALHRCANNSFVE